MIDVTQSSPENRSAVTTGTTGSINFDDVVINFQLRNVRGPEISTFLVALAAFQRGLQVVFYKTAPDLVAQFQGSLKSGVHGAIFSVSDGVDTHFFNRTMGDLTSREASMRAEDKDITKRILASVGIRTPEGVVVRAGDVQGAVDFMASSGRSRFVVKPLRGSLGKDTHIEVSADEVKDVIANVQTGEWLIEEFISGSEVRAYVVGDKCVSVSMNLCPSVTGNGVDSISTLVGRRNAVRAQNVYLSAMSFDPRAQYNQYLAKQGLDPETVPLSGTMIKLSDTKIFYKGADCLNALDRVNDSFHQVAVATCKALGLPNAGLDIIISDDVSRPGAFVLEANQRAYIGTHNFPSLGKSDNNAISEAIIDHYFPNSCGNRQFSLASFSFPQIVQMFQTGQATDVVLPVLRPDWLHARLHFSDAAVAESVWNILLSVRGFGCLLNLSNGRRVADVLLSRESRAALLPHRAEIVALFPQAEAILFDVDESLP